MTTNSTPIIFTTHEILNHGLLAVGFTQQRLDSVKLEKNLSRFRSNFVAHPCVYVDLFERLQTTKIEEAQVDCSILGVDKTLKYFFMAIYLLSKYPTEEEAESAFLFHICDRTFREHG